MSFICGSCHQEHKVPKREEDEREKVSTGSAGLACVLALVREMDEIKLQLGEAKFALEIALPGMVHTFSGHVYEDGKPVQFVDGCAKCRAMKVLGETEKRKCEKGHAMLNDGCPCRICGAGNADHP